MNGGRETADVGLPQAHHWPLWVDGRKDIPGGVDEQIHFLHRDGTEQGLAFTGEDKGIGGAKTAFKTDDHTPGNGEEDDLAVRQLGRALVNDGNAERLPDDLVDGEHERPQIGEYGDGELANFIFADVVPAVNLYVTAI